MVTRPIRREVQSKRRRNEDFLHSAANIEFTAYTRCWWLLDNSKYLVKYHLNPVKLKKKYNYLDGRYLASYLVNLEIISTPRPLFRRSCWEQSITLAFSFEQGTPPTQTQPTSVPYRPSADCAYSQLVNRIQGAGLGGNTLPDSQSPATVQQQTPNQMQIINQMTLEQQYHHYYYVQQFYEYWRHSVINSEQGGK